MDDKYDEVFRQYNFRIDNIRRARGALLLETDKGVKLFRSLPGSRVRNEFENKLLTFLEEQGFKNTDQFCINNNGQIITQNQQGDSFIVKNWFKGEECNLREIAHVKLASRNLAKLHKCLRSVPLAEERTFLNCHIFTDVFAKHNRELKRVKTYIIGKRQKNQFEVLFLNGFKTFFNQAQEAQSMIQELDFTNIKKKCINNQTMVHGSYTYHNIMYCQDRVYTTNFEKADLGIQVHDLYYFMRKVLEKNNWNVILAQKILAEYNQYNPLDKDELTLLYILMCYPEKFWKITNFYYNGKKSWVSGRTIQKLINIQQQEEEKKIFLQNLYQYCIIDS